MSAPKRIFSDEQLTSMAARPIDELMAAIDAGETERAKALAQTSYDSYAHLHDGYMCWIAGLLTYIYRQGGATEVEAAERFAHGLEA
ncbi:MAG: hypothetical protein LBH64_05390, partial [Coriobacteriales bacterium]|nr:hypothetical protein [Coriobacteriales bacterium]